jgi:hypothetical protein
MILDSYGIRSSCTFPSKLILQLHLIQCYKTFCLIFWNYKQLLKIRYPGRYWMSRNTVCAIHLVIQSQAEKTNFHIVCWIIIHLAGSRPQGIRLDRRQWKSYFFYFHLIFADNLLHLFLFLPWISFPGLQLSLLISLEWYFLAKV